MRTPLSRPAVIAVAVALLFSSCRKNLPPFCHCSPDEIVATVSVFSSGLNDPRGLKFGPDGYLYVAEGGLGGSDSTTSCMQVVPPVGPYKGSNTGSRISRVSANGARSTYVDGLPSSTTAMGEISGVADIAFIGQTLYALLAGAGCSHGVTALPNGVLKINPDRSWKLIADLSSFQMSNPVKTPAPGDFEPDGSWYSMINVEDRLYALEPNHGELDKVTQKGDITRIVDISASQGHIVPTAMTFHNGSFYVGNLSTFPIAGHSSIYKISMSGSVSVVYTGFSTVLGVVFDKTGALYVLENTTGNPFPTPGTGDIIRIDPTGTRKVLVSGLDLPTAMTFGSNDKLYVSNKGFGFPAGQGEVLEIGIGCAKQSGSSSY
jgi:hypothetical protein